MHCSDPEIAHQWIHLHADRCHQRCEISMANPVSLISTEFSVQNRHQDKNASDNMQLLFYCYMNFLVIFHMEDCGLLLSCVCMYMLVHVWCHTTMKSVIPLSVIPLIRKSCTLGIISQTCHIAGHHLAAW